MPIFLRPTSSPSDLSIRIASGLRLWTRRIPSIAAIFSADKCIGDLLRVWFKTFQLFNRYVPIKPPPLLPRVGRMKEEVEPPERLERLELILVDSLLQERHDDIRQLFRLFMRDVMTGAVDGLDLGVGEKLYPRATHGLHEITFGAINE